MLSTSRDILNLVLAISIAALATFLCWSIYYFADAMRRIHKIIKRVEVGMGKVEGIIDNVKGKLENGSVYLTLLGELAGKAMEMVRERQAKKAAGKKK